jgi:3',5'-cyclic AMP phosphodiesterase CpdA
MKHLHAWIPLLGLVAFSGLASAAGQDSAGFLARPYLQLGDAPTRMTGELALLWQTEDVDANWAVEIKAATATAWSAPLKPTFRRVALASVAPHRVYQVTLASLAAGVGFEYRVKKGTEVVFSAQGRARKHADQQYRFVAVGDIAQGTPAQKAIAFQIGQARPDFAMITGDIVYARGRITEYREKFWPVYNADDASPTTGAPSIRTFPFIAAPGNHDIAARDFEKYPDGLAYFYYWNQPLNGPETGPFTLPLTGPEANTRAFLEAAGKAYPRAANFSFDYGNAHWTVLDANPYVDWRDPGLRDWVARDLASARGATWRFVAYHHPAFNSAKEHFEQQEMRLVADLLEAGKVDVVFNGHVHNYQRTFPIRFVADRDAQGKMIREKNLVPGKWTLDKSFDGAKDTTPEGVIHIVTGAGGAGLYNPEQQAQPETWQTFTDKFISTIHSITVVDVNDRTLTVRQVDVDGKTIDEFKVTKNNQRND